MLTPQDRPAVKIDRAIAKEALIRFCGNLG
jgi:hypothetical protein